MSKNEYLIALSRELRKLPKPEFDRAIEYYTEYFEDAGPENEQEVIRELGNPREVAAQIKMDAAIKSMEEPKNSAKKGISMIWLIILGICATPMALPMIIVVLVFFAAILVCVAAILFAMAAASASGIAGGILALIAGVVGIFLTSLPNVLTLIGGGISVVGIGILMGFVTGVFAKGMFKGIWAILRKIIKRRR